MTKVINMRKKVFKNSPDYVYIGRGSKWGNPFRIGKDGNRQEVIEKYKQYLLKNKYLLSCLPELKNKTLGCFCKPLACHGDILIEMIHND